MSTEHDPRDEGMDSESRAAMLAGLLAAGLVILLTVMALIALSPMDNEVSAIAAALA